MNWKKESENELRDYGKKKEALLNIPELLTRIDCEISLLKLDSLREKYKQDIFLDNVIKRSELERNLSLIKQRISLVETGLCKISTDDRKLLEYFYIERPGDYVTKLCQEFGYEKSSIYSRKDTALRLFTLAMYDVERAI